MIGDTCLSLTDALKPLFETYGEEQIVASLRDLLAQSYVSDDDDSLIVDIARRRASELDALNTKWCKENIG